jgi:hypothetical protein
VSHTAENEALSLANQALRRLRWEVRTVAGRYPSLYLPVIRWRYRPGQFQIPVRPDTELVIDGFLRSGTTFAFTAFELVQPRKVRVAHHVHAPAAVIAAVRCRIPAILLIREPEETVLSLLIRLPYLSAREGLAGYVRYYRPLLPLRSSLAVAPFETVITDFGSVIHRLNERFGTSFVEFTHSEENVAKVMELIEKGDRRQFGTGMDLERAAGRPSEARDRLKEELRDEYASPRLAPLRARAERIHRRFVT